MKQITLTMIATLVVSTIAIAQIPNSSFENWSSMGLYDNPDGWDNMNSMTVSAGVYTCLKGTPGFPGSPTCLKLVSKDMTGMGVIPGIAISGQMEMVTMKPKTGFAYTERPASFLGTWQHMGYGDDEGFIAVYLTKWNAGAGVRDTIGHLFRPLGAMQMTWSSFSFPITYESQEAPDSAMIILSSSGDDPVADSYLYVDNLSFFGRITGTPEPRLSSLMSIYPNPVNTDELTVKMEGKPVAISIIQLFDIQGKLLKQIPAGNLSGDSKVDVSGLPQGTYVIKLIATEGVVVSKFIRQ